MPNPNPPLENLALGRGKRPKLGNETVAMRMSPVTRDRLEKIAEGYNCMFGGNPWVAGLLEKIGSGELVVVPAPKYALFTDESMTPKQNPKQAVRDRIAQKHPNSSKV